MNSRKCGSAISMSDFYSDDTDTTIDMPDGLLCSLNISLTPDGELQVHIIKDDVITDQRDAIGILAIALQDILEQYDMD